MGVFIKNSDTVKAWEIADLIEGVGVPPELLPVVEQGRITIVPGSVVILAVHNKPPLVGTVEDWLIQTSEKRFNIIKGAEFADKYIEIGEVKA